MSTLEASDVDTESGTRPRRPDRAVYVPRALRAHDSADDRPPESKRTPTDARGPARDKSAHGTPRRSLDKQFCNVYTPPHLRSAPAAPHAGDEPVPSVPNSDSAIFCSDSSFKEDDQSFYIGSYFTNGQLGFYRPSCFESGDGWRADARAPSMQDPRGRVGDIAGEYYDKGEDAEADELKRASREINRSSKRIIKQSFDSDVLVISDPVEEAPAPSDDGVAEETEPSKPKLEAKASLKREENDWDAVFDDSGECLDPSLLEELTATVGRVHVSRAQRDYGAYQSRGQALLGAAPDALAHVVEVYDFPSEFKTNDLLALFSEYKDTGFEIKWVDDTHALIVFSSANIAAEVVSAPRSLARCRPLHAATPESRNKAKKCAEFLQPYRQRPETCTALARRLVSGALGVRLSTARQERAEERRLITRAREKKRQAALHKEAAWDGSLANASLDA